ncbi:putative sigma 54 modulation protein/ribosomal protein S30EA [Chthoniobacter flavus Ellin428]|uniref:Putative sigma 54 modulation protein/ribosomal protein S30EA n=1 Tax=Chthoniobacter flavus Ellin428 TaxID=497964 RepID=B4D6Y7_9BACT|nr:HPF/RaiA family ribosome-associated protein [Chthoniobacter flavus]EDY17938.1 putative sigma 54 modulation protein/ribosomal protein S30EA [Chthoniobacter flavus Ellin428]TCO88545.1 ribosome-associated translation inhibitor RaiA [Chthoniobacter flavus]
MRPIERPAAIRWHIVNRHLHPGVTVREKLAEKIAALSQLLVHFPPDSIHLQVVLDKMAKKGLYEVRLTLRLPSNILHAEKTGTDLLVTINTAVNALKREVMSLKADLRGDYRWKRPARRAALRTAKEARFASPPPADGVLGIHVDLAAQLFAAHHPSLLSHAVRVLRMAELTGDIPVGALDAGDVVDEVARIVIDPIGGTPKPAPVTYQQWFFRLVQEEVDRQVRRFAEEMRLRVIPPEGISSHEAQICETQPTCDRSSESFEAEEESLPEDRVVDGQMLPPDSAIAGRELVERLQQEVKTWPSLERQIFELHYLVGLEVADVAKITHQPEADILAFIEKIQPRLRDFLRRTVCAPRPVDEELGLPENLRSR